MIFRLKPGSLFWLQTRSLSASSLLRSWRSMPRPVRVTVTGNLWPLLVFKRRVASEKLWRFRTFFLRIRGFFFFSGAGKYSCDFNSFLPYPFLVSALLRRHLENLHCSDEQCSKPTNLGLSWILSTFATISVQHFSNDPLIFKFLQVIPCNSWQQEGLSWKPTPGAEGAEGSQSRSWETESSSREHRWVSPALVPVGCQHQNTYDHYHDLMELGVILGKICICLKDWKETYRDIASFVLVCWFWDVFEAASERTLSISAGVLGGSWLMNLDDFTIPFWWLPK